jgi:hypothetical protein
MPMGHCRVKLLPYRRARLYHAGPNRDWNIAMRRTAVVALLLMLPVVPLHAQTAPDLLRCAAIARDAERLACYDAAVANASPEARAASEVRAKESARIAAEEAAAAAIVAKAKAEADAKARREAFGAEDVTTRPDRFKNRPEEIQKVEAGIVEVLSNQSGLGVFILDNGQIWRQADTVGLPNIRPGDKVEVARTNYGGYNMTFLRSKRVSLVKRMR